MAGLFDTLGISGTGLTVHRKWMDAIADNLSNANDTVPGDQPAFAERYVQAASAPGGGAQWSVCASGRAPASSRTTRKTRRLTQLVTCATPTSTSPGR